MINRYNMEDFYKHTHKPWPILTKVIHLPISSRLTLFFANYLKFISPNLLTIISLLSFVMAAYFYYNKLFFIGALFVYVRDLLDDIDGLLARMTNRTSKLGHFLDCSCNYIGTAACLVALILSKETKLIMVVVPFTIITLFLFSLQTSILYLYVPYLTKKDYVDFLDYFDAKTITIFVIPLFYFILKKLPISFYNILIFMTILIVVRQFAWLFYYKKDLADSFKGKINTEGKYQLSEGFYGLKD